MSQTSMHRVSMCKLVNFSSTMVYISSTIVALTDRQEKKCMFLKSCTLH